jgi:hypothetical protein
MVVRGSQIAIGLKRRNAYGNREQRTTNSERPNDLQHIIVLTKFLWFVTATSTVWVAFSLRA